MSFAVEADRDVPARHARPGTAIGIDLGVKTLITGVDDYGHGDHRRGAATAGDRVAPAAQRLPCALPQAVGISQAEIGARLARLHARVANVRTDALHKATATLAAGYETVVVEDLNVAGMIRNRRLARAVADQGFGAARRMLAYKTVDRAGRWSPPTAGIPPRRPARAAAR